MNKHIQYLRYVLRHKWFVLQAGMTIGAPLWQLLIHDWSKFLPSEWTPYVRKFYGGKYPERVISEFIGRVMTQAQVDAEFDAAWNHHQKRNLHHWQYWVLREDSGATKALPMPKRYILEMLADWMGAGKAITGRNEVVEWYAANKDKMILHPRTRHEVEKRLRLYEAWKQREAVL